MTYFILLITFSLTLCTFVDLALKNLELKEELEWYKADRAQLVLQVASMAGKLAELSFFASMLKETK